MMNFTFTFSLTHTCSTRNNALHELALIKMIGPRLGGPRGFLIRYANEHMK